MNAFQQHVAFVKELVSHLHRYGTSAGRLESAVGDVAEILQMDITILASATGCWLSFADPKQPLQPPIVHILRLPVGGIDLGRMADCDQIAYDVANGIIDSEQGLIQLRMLDHKDSTLNRLRTILCCGLASMGIPAIFSGTGFGDLSSSFLLGLLTGVMLLLGTIHWRAGEAMEAMTAFIITLLACLINTFIAALSMNIVIVAGLIALMPGLSLTTSIAELASGQLMTGVARFGGAIVSLMKLIFGTVAALGCAKIFGWNGGAEPLYGALQPWGRNIALALCALSFAGLFHAKPKHIFLVFISVLLGHWIAVNTQNLAHGLFGTLPVGTFVAAAIITTLSNIYSSVFHRPGAIVRVPGIIMLVPGSIGFKAGQMLWSNQADGSSLALLAIGTIIAIVAGTLLGNLLVAARRRL